MPHLIIEYTANLADDGDIAGLLRQANQTLIAQGSVIPIGGVRSRAICLTEYCIADGLHDDAFVHATLKLGAGRDCPTRQRIGDALFAVFQAHFAALYARRTLALSMEIVEFSESGTWKQNNIHDRYRKA